MSGQDAGFLVVLVLGTIIAIGIFVALRALVLWYWGITEHLDNQKRIIELLEQIAPPSQSQAQHRTPPNPLTKPR